MNHRLTHLDATGQARMVDVSAKDESVREATARVRVLLAPATFALVQAGTSKKGDVLQVARIAGIQAAKRTAELIPLCHPLPLTWAGVDISLDEPSHAVEISATCRTRAATGVEMEALTAASVAALTVYDMCKAVERGIRITELRVVHKAGGASGEYREPIARGELVSINISTEKGTKKVPVHEARLLVESGIEGDAHAGPWHRQISLLAEESIAPMRGRGVDLPPGVFAENLTVRGLRLTTLPIGARLRVGEALLEVTQIGKECHHGCEIRRLVGDCVMPREGIFTRVLEGGLLRAGDPIQVLSPPEEPERSES
ncbi:MAG: cyclic pyranopterin monophosphate synthase MoaC [Pseudomonadota bacterium]